MERGGSSSLAPNDGHPDGSRAQQQSSDMPASRRSSRRRTRSMALLQSNEANANEDDDEPTTSRRLRRRIKGKSQQIDTNKVDTSEGITNQTKGKERQTDGVEAAKAEEEVSCSDSNVMEEASAQIPCSSQSSRRLSPPHVDPPQTPVLPSSTATPPQVQHDTVQSRSGGISDRRRSPYDLTDEERNRARDQIARVLGVNVAPQSAANTAIQGRPSMLSALLTDILGLRSGQAASSSATPNSPSNVGSSDNLTPRLRSTNGGTTVIVQGALISRTLPSRTDTSTSTADNAAQQETESASTIRRSQSQPAESSAAEDAQSPAAVPPLPATTETQVATIEEQAAMLIRLLSIATAATAASLVSRMPPRPSSGSDSTIDSDGNTTTTTTTNSSAPATSSPQNTAQASAQTASEAASTEAPTSSTSAPPSSFTSSWLHASQTYQVLRDRFQSLRSRLRGLRAAVQTEQNQVNIAEQATENQQVWERVEATQTAEAEASRTEDDAAGSLRSLSSMLQDAIRDGISSSDRSGEAQSTETVAAGSSSQAPTTQAQSVHATLSAVRGGTLVRGSPPSFDRFLFDLRGDLDAAIRRLPRADQTTQDSGAITSNADLPIQEQIIRHRRALDVHDGQLAFYRQYIFHQAAEESQSNLLPCVVVGVRNLEPNNRSIHIQRVNSEAEANVLLPEEDEDTDMQDVSITESSASSTEDTAAPRSSTGTSDSQDERPMSRFLLFVSGGHYPPSHPVLFANRTEASRDLMILMEFLGAMASLHNKPNTTVTKEQIEKSKLRNVNGNLDKISSLVKEKKIMENTSERCLICLEDWKDEDEDRRLLECAHLFHAPCIDQWLTASNNSCPLCRRQAVPTSSSTTTTGSFSTPVSVPSAAPSAE